MQLKALFCDGRKDQVVAEVQRYRKALFVDECGWTLRVEHGREIDQFDTPDAVHLMLLIDGILCGTFRATRCDRPYLAAEVFPQLALSRPYPQRPEIWEISRFGVTRTVGETSVARLTYALMFLFARRVGASALVAIADLAHERVLRSLGIRTSRYGPPQLIGVDASGRVLRAIAGEIPMALQNPAVLTPLLSSLNDLDILDVSDVFGPSRISA